MKSTLLIAALSLCLAAPLWAQSDDSSDTSTTPPKGHHWHHGGGSQLTQDERTELKTAHDTAIKDNPDLATEGKKLHEEMHAYMKKMHDAMVTADPNVKPILDKLEAGHHHHGPPPADDDSSNQ
jgi:Spy/CpxP family protein refolding chaperone